MMGKTSMPEAMQKANQWRGAAPHGADADFARAVCSHFALPMGQVDREMSMSVDAFGDLKLGISIRATPGDLIGIASQMLVQQEAATNRKLKEFLGKPNVMARD